MRTAGESEVDIFIRNVQSILLATGSGAVRREADAWVQNLRRGGARALALCAAVLAAGDSSIGGPAGDASMPIQPHYLNSMILPARIMAAQTMVAIIKKTREAVSAESLFAAMTLPSARTAPPVLTQLALALAALGAKTLLLQQQDMHHNSPSVMGTVVSALLEGIAQHCAAADAPGVACMVLSSMPETLLSREIKLDRKDEVRRHVIVASAQQREMRTLSTFLQQFATSISSLDNRFAMRLLVTHHESGSLERLDSCLGCCGAWLRSLVEAAPPGGGGGGGAGGRGRVGPAAEHADAFLDCATAVLRSWLDDPLFQVVIPQCLLGLCAVESEGIASQVMQSGDAQAHRGLLQLDAWSRGQESDDDARELESADLRAFRAASELLCCWLEGASLCADTDLLVSKVDYFSKIIQLISYRASLLFSRYASCVRRQVSGVFARASPASSGCARLEAALQHWSESVDEMQELLRQIMETILDTASSPRLVQSAANVIAIKAVVASGLQALRVCTIDPCSHMLELSAAIDSSGPHIINGCVDLATIDIWMRLRVVLKRHQISVGGTLLSVLGVLQLYRDGAFASSPEDSHFVGNTIIEVLHIVRSCSELFPDPHFLATCAPVQPDASASSLSVQQLKLPLQLLFPQFDKGSFGWTREVKDELVDFRNEIRGTLRSLCTQTANGRDGAPAIDFVARIVSESHIELQNGLAARGEIFDTGLVISVARAFVNYVSSPAGLRDAGAGCPSAVTLGLPLWTRAESWVHILTACNKGIIDSLISVTALNDLNGLIGWKSAVIKVIALLNQYHEHKGILRLSSLVIADLTPVLWQLSSFIRSNPSTHIEILKSSASSICASVSVPESKYACPNADTFFGSPCYDFEVVQQHLQLSFRVKQDHTGVVSALKLVDRLSPLIVEETLRSLSLPRFAVVIDDFLWGVRWCTAFISGMRSGSSAKAEGEAPSEILLRNFLQLISNPELLSRTMTQKSFQILFSGMIRIAVLSAFVDPWRPEAAPSSAWNILYDDHPPSSEEPARSSSARRTFPRLLCCCLGSILAIAAAAFSQRDSSGSFDSVFRDALDSMIKKLFFRSVAAAVRVSTDEDVSALLGLVPGSDNSKLLEAAVADLAAALLGQGQQTCAILHQMTTEVRAERMNSVTYHTYVRMLGSSPGLLSSALQSLISCVQQLPKLDHNLKSKACDMGSQFFGSSVCILESTLSGLLQSISTSPPATFRSEDALSLVLAIQDAFHIFTPAGLLRCPPLSGSASGGSKVLPGCCATCPLIGGIDDLNNFGNGVFGEIKNVSCFINQVLQNHHPNSSIYCAALRFLDVGALDIISSWQRVMPVLEVTRHVINVSKEMKASYSGCDSDSSFMRGHLEFWIKIMWLCGFSSRADGVCFCHHRSVSLISGWRSNTYETQIAPSLEALKIQARLDGAFSNWITSFRNGANSAFQVVPMYRFDVVTSSDLRSMFGDIDSSRHSCASLSSIPSTDEVFHLCEIALSIGVHILLTAVQSTTPELQREVSSLLHAATSYLLIALGPVTLPCVRCEIDINDFATRCVEDSLECTMPDGSLITTLSKAIQVHRVLSGQMVGMQSINAQTGSGTPSPTAKAPKEDRGGSDSRGGGGSSSREDAVPIVCPEGSGLGNAVLTTAWLQRGSAEAVFRFVWLYVNVGHAYLKLSERELEDVVQLLSKLYVVFGLSQASELAAAASAWSRNTINAIATRAGSSSGKSLLQGKEVRVIHEAVHSVGRVAASDWRKVTLVIKNLVK